MKFEECDAREAEKKIGVAQKKPGIGWLGQFSVFGLARTRDFASIRIYR